MMIGNTIKVVLIIMNLITSLAGTIALSLLLLVLFLQSSHIPWMFTTNYKVGLPNEKVQLDYNNQLDKLKYVYIFWLVVSTPLKNIIQSVGMILPNIWKQIFPQTTSQYYYIENGVYRPTYTMGGIALYKLFSYYHSCNLNYGVYNTSGR